MPVPSRLGHEPNFHAWMEQRRWARDRHWQTQPGSGELPATLGGCPPCLVVGSGGVPACLRCPCSGSAMSCLDPGICRSRGILLPWMGSGAGDRAGVVQGWQGAASHIPRPTSRAPRPAPRILHPVSLAAALKPKGTALPPSVVGFRGGGGCPVPRCSPVCRRCGQGPYPAAWLRASRSSCSNTRGLGKYLPLLLLGRLIAREGNTAGAASPPLPAPVPGGGALGAWGGALGAHGGSGCPRCLWPGRLPTAQGGRDALCGQAPGEGAPGRGLRRGLSPDLTPPLTPPHPAPSPGGR